MKLTAEDVASLDKNGTKYGGRISDRLVRHMSSQLNERLAYLREQGKVITYKSIADLIGGGKAWVNDVFLGKFTDMRFSSMTRLATVLGCEWRITLVPKELLNDPEYLAIDGSSGDQKRELTPRERDILCWVISRIERNPEYSELGFNKLKAIKEILDPRPQ